MFSHRSFSSLYGINNHQFVLWEAVFLIAWGFEVDGSGSGLPVSSSALSSDESVNSYIKNFKDKDTFSNQVYFTALPKSPHAKQAWSPNYCSVVRGGTCLPKKWSLLCLWFDHDYVHVYMHVQGSSSVSPHFSVKPPTCQPFPLTILATPLPKYHALVIRL